jgi:hypothetical protein|tara:strand:+ start:545 stop:721 length:177 start_codon:yes stop_codon:yes gene_type:complete
MVGISPRHQGCKPERKFMLENIFTAVTTMVAVGLAVGISTTARNVMDRAAGIRRGRSR